MSISVKNNFCIGCGMCKVVCPENAIVMKFSNNEGYFIPQIDDQKCTHCGICLDVCSGFAVNHTNLNKLRKYSPKDSYLGKYKDILITRSTDNIILENCASGGTVTQILSNLFDDNKIDAALVVKQLQDNLESNSAVLVKSKEELLKNQRSMYFNVPLCERLENVINTDLRIAIVALPCHLHSILKSYKYLNLEKNVKFIFGLMCGGTYSQKALSGFLQKNSIPKKEIKKIDFRYGDWPGKMKIELHNGNIFDIKRDNNFQINYLKRCFFCNDLLNKHADISIGDNWLSTDHKGENIVILRNPEIIKHFQNISSKPITPVELHRSHRIRSRRQTYLKANIFAAKLFSWKIPNIIPNHILKPKLKNYLKSILDIIMFSMNNTDGIFAKKYLNFKGFVEHYFIKSSFWNEIKKEPAKKKRITILISEADVTGNKGAAAMLFCIMQQINEKMPAVDFVVTSQHVNDFPGFKKEQIINDKAQNFDIALIKLWLWWLLKKIGIKLNILLKDKVLRKYFQADLVISASGISFIEDFGLIKIYHFSKYLQIPLLLEKRVIKFTQSFGPFNSFYNKFLAKKLLKHSSKIFSRGIHSTANLAKISITQNVSQVPDIAFILERSKPKKFPGILTREKNIFGISPNLVCSKLDRNNIYTSKLIELGNYIIENIEGSIIYLLPHSFEPNASQADDLFICRTIYDGIKDKSKCVLDANPDYTPQEAKWIISHFDFFIGSRFHSIIAAASSFVPFFSIGWHWKYEETINWLKLEKNHVQIWELNNINLLDRFRQVYKNMSEQKIQLKTRVPELKKMALTAIDRIVLELKQ